MRMICVVDRRWGVSREEALLFYIPTDLRFFKQTTTGNVVVMGSRTLRSFPGQRPLKDRTNIVLSAQEIDTPGIIRCESMDELMEEISKYDPDSVFLIGGASMYDQLMDCCTEALITQVDAIGDADREIQSLDDRPGWELVEVSEPVEDNGFRFVFTKYVNHDVKDKPTPLDALIAAEKKDAAAAGETAAGAGEAEAAAGSGEPESVIAAIEEADPEAVVAVWDDGNPGPAVAVIDDGEVAVVIEEDAESAAAAVIAEANEEA